MVEETAPGTPGTPASAGDAEAPTAAETPSADADAETPSADADAEAKAAAEAEAEAEAAEAEAEAERKAKAEAQAQAAAEESAILQAQYKFRNIVHGVTEIIKGNGKEKYKTILALPSSDEINKLITKLENIKIHTEEKVKILLCGAILKQLDSNTNNFYLKDLLNSKMKDLDMNIDIGILGKYEIPQDAKNALIKEDGLADSKKDNDKILNVISAFHNTDVSIEDSRRTEVAANSPSATNSSINNSTLSVAQSVEAEHSAVSDPAAMGGDLAIVNNTNLDNSESSDDNSETASDTESNNSFSTFSNESEDNRIK